MHTFTLSLFSSALTPTGSNKGCSITRGNSYLYQTYFSSHLIFSIHHHNNKPNNHWIMKSFVFQSHWFGKKMLILKIEICIMTDRTRRLKAAADYSMEIWKSSLSLSHLIILFHSFFFHVLIYIRYSLNIFCVVFSLFRFDSMVKTRFFFQSNISLSWVISSSAEKL